MKKEFDVLVISYDGGTTGKSIERGSGCSTYMYGVESEFSRVKVGGKIVDLRTADDIISAVLKGPLLDLGLKPNEISSISKETIENSIFAQAVRSQRNNPLGSLIKLEEACQREGFSSLDSVGVDIYLEYWKNNGAKIGAVTETNIVWE